MNKTGAEDATQPLQNYNNAVLSVERVLDNACVFSFPLFYQKEKGNRPDKMVTHIMSVYASLVVAESHRQKPILTNQPQMKRTKACTR